ncbi:RTA1 like protein-domain-containing protein [Hypoxylon sp. FL1150]|nr:RTA1 like protein-domain-containing protein [Hypoxylon sp. FL1150]
MGSIAECTFDTCPVAASPYGYPPSTIADAIFFIIHIGSLLACLLYSYYLTDSNKRWLNFSIPVSIACLFEAIGYAVRLGSVSDPWNVALYATSTSFLLVAPALVSAGIYMTIPETIAILGVEHSLVNTTHYPHLIWIDVVGFVLELVGIIISFSDLSPDRGLGPHIELGNPIIAAGIGLQSLSLICFLVLFAVVLFRAAVAHHQFGYTTFHPIHGFLPMAHRFKFFIAMVLISVMCLLGRNLYQMVILGTGLNSSTAKNQALFAGLDSLLVAEAVVGLVVAHPVRFLRDGVEKRRGSRSTTPMMAEEQRATQYGIYDRPTGHDHTPWGSAANSTTNFI